MAEKLADKFCKLCGTNLNGQKRTKNAAGDYYCPACWKSASSIFGDDLPAPASGASDPVAPPAEVVPTKGRTEAVAPRVQVVRSESQMTMGQAVVDGAKKGAADGLFSGLSKTFFLLQFVAAIGISRKLYPNINNGATIIVGLTAGIAAMLEIDLMAKAMHIRYRWLDAETLKSRVGVIGIIGFALAYALAIFLAITGA
jgi:hypothetical protein